MPTNSSTMDDLLERVHSAGRVTSRKMFGEYCLYIDGKPVAFVCDDCLFVKITDAGKELAGEVELGSAYPGSKPYFRLPPEAWTDRDWLVRLLTATFHALPVPKPKSKKKSK